MRTVKVRNGMRRSVAAAVLSVATLALSACGGSSGDTDPTGQAAPKPPTSTSNKASGPPLAGVKPCDVFTPEQAKKLGLTTQGSVNEFDDSTCDWELGEHLINVSVYKDMALNEINFSGDKKTPTTFQGHEALRVRPGEDRCSLAFAVTDSTSVVVRSTADVSAAPGKACEIVKKATPMVEATIFGS